MKELESHFRTVSITQHAIKRMIRIKTDKLYVLAVQHMYHCENAHRCEIRLWDLHSSIIALVCLQYEIERLVELFELDDMHNDLQNIEKQCLKDIQIRVRRSTFFSNMIPTTQLISCKQTLSNLDSTVFDYKTSCLLPPEHSDEECEKCEATALKSTTPIDTHSFPSMTSLITRCTSLCSNGTESPGPPSKKLELRDSILSVFIAHRSEMKTTVRDSALELINALAFQRAAEDDASLSCLDAPQLAFCVLSSISIAQDASSMLFTQKINLGIALRLGIGIDACESAIKAIRPLLPDVVIHTEVASDFGESAHFAGAEDLFS